MDVILIVAAAWVLLYLGSCWRNPYTPRKCWWCHGKTRRTGWWFRGYRDRSACWWCGSNPKRRRVGAKILGRG